MCSLFVTRSLIASGEQIAQARIYEDSVKDFITRKASGLNTAFITGFIRRCPLLAWGARTVTIEAIPEAVNGYRQTQAFVIIQTLITQLPQQVRYLRFELIFYCLTALVGYQKSRNDNLHATCLRGVLGLYP